ncbi:family 16 glycosylhydrolase [Streptosporangium lutulentum]
MSPGGPCNETTGLGASRACPGSSCQSAFHTYRFEWDRAVTPNQLRWYVDGQQFHSVSQAQFDAGTWNAMTGHQGYFLLLNVAMGGAFPNALAGQTPTAATVSGRPMLVDYVAVWQSGSGTPPTGTPTPLQEVGWTPARPSRPSATRRSRARRWRRPPTPAAGRTSARSATVTGSASTG